MRPREASLLCGEHAYTVFRRVFFAPVYPACPSKVANGLQASVQGLGKGDGTGGARVYSHGCGDAGSRRVVHDRSISPDRRERAGPSK